MNIKRLRVTFRPLTRLALQYRDEGWEDDSPPGPSFWDKLFGKKAEDEK